MNYNDLIDTARIDAANAALAALQLAARDAEAEIGKAEAAVKTAHAEAQQAADAGAGVDKLLAMEAEVETAQRRLSVSQRIAAGATLRLNDGRAVHANEIKQSHGKAMNAAMVRFIAVYNEGRDAFAKLEALGVEHRDLVVAISAMGRDAGSGLPGIIDSARKLVAEDGKLMAEDEFRNRTSQNQHHEWDSAAQKLRWVE